MKIILEENDSFIQPDGKATMIVVAVIKDDGKVVRFPYSASRSMSALIDDINVKIGNAPISEERKYGVESFARDTGKTVQEAAKTILELSGIHEGKIQKEDLVKCIKINPDRLNMKGQTPTIDLEVGQIYRVLKITMNGPNVSSYDVIDDTEYHRAETPRRIMAFPDEVEFYQKRKSPPIKEIGTPEEIFNCPSCQKRVVCNKMEDGKYYGKCDDCNQEIISDTVRQTVAV